MILEIIRNINLKLFLDEPLSGSEKNYILAVGFLKEKIQGLNSYISKNFLSYVFYGKTKNNLLFEYNKNSKTIRVTYGNVFSVFKNVFLLEEDDIKYIIKKYILNILLVDVINILVILGSDPVSIVNDLQIDNKNNV